MRRDCNAAAGLGHCGADGEAGLIPGCGPVGSVCRSALAGLEAGALGRWQAVGFSETCHV